MDGSFPTAEMFFPLRKSPWHLLWAIWEVRKGNDMDSYKTSEWKWNSNHVIKTVFQWTEIGVSVCMFSLWAQSLYKKGGRGRSTVKEGWWLLRFWAASRKEQGWAETRKNAEWEYIQKHTVAHGRWWRKLAYGSMQAWWEAEELRKVSALLLLGGSMPIRCTIQSSSTRQHSVISPLCSAWFFY